MSSQTTIPRPVPKAELRPAIYRERYALLQRILWSRQFERSERLRSFLEFVTTSALSDPDAEVHEQEIGCKVFDRRPDYDTASDNIVRVSASQVRKKLEEYFQTEGATENTVLDIPKGRYTPSFRDRTSIPLTSAVALVSSSVLPWHSRPSLLRSVSGGLLVLLVVCVGLLVRLHFAAPQAANSPAVATLWTNLFSASQPTHIVVSDSSLSLYEDLLGKQLTLAEYLAAHSQAGPDPTFAPDAALGNFARLAFGRALTSKASTSIVARIADLKGNTGSGILVETPKDFNMNGMKFGNVVLLGSPRANPWVELIENKLNFRYTYDQATHHSAFQNHAPKPGEQSSFPTDSSTSYCRIAYLPNLSGNGNILNVAGTETEGTEGGGEYITSEKTLTQLRRNLGVTRGPLPYFEVLLRSDRVGGATPQLSIVATRIIQPE
jgi:hypothetical protein